MKNPQTRTGFVIKSTSGKYGPGFVTRTAWVSPSIYDAASWRTLDEAAAVVARFRPRTATELTIVRVDATRHELRLSTVC